MALRLLRKIDQATINDLHDPSGDLHEDAQGNKIRQDWLYLDKNRKWFRDGYVDNDAPRAGFITEAIMAGTTGFAIWDDEQGLLKTFGPDQLMAAEAARRGAKMVLGVEFDIPDATNEPVELFKSTDEAESAVSGLVGV